MNNFVKGVLVGIGVSLLFAPMSGEDARRALKDRFDEWKESLPEDSRLNQYTQQVSDKVSETKDNLQVYTQQAVAKAKDTRDTLGDKAQQSIYQAKQAGQDMMNKTRQSVDSARNGGPSSIRVTPDSDLSDLSGL